MFMHRKFAALDIGSSKVVSIIGCEDEAKKLSALGIGTAEYPVSMVDPWANPKGFIKVIQEAHFTAERQAKKRIRDVYVGVPGEFIRIFFRDVTLDTTGPDGTVSATDLDMTCQESTDVAAPSNSVLLHHTPILHMLDGKVFWDNPLGQKAAQITCYYAVTMANVDYLHRVESLLSDAGLGVIAFTAAPNAVARLVYQTSEAKRSLVVLDGGYLSTDLMVFEGQDTVFHQSIPVGGLAMQERLADGLGISMAQAELVKRRCSLGVCQDGSLSGVTLTQAEGSFAVDMARAQEIMERCLGDLLYQIRQELELFGMTLDNRTRVNITGGGFSMIRGAREFFGQALGVAVRQYAPQLSLTNSPVHTTAMAILHFAVYGDGSEPRLSWLQDAWRKIKDFI